MLRTGRYQLQNILTFHNWLRTTNGIPDFEHPNMIKHDIKWDRIVNIKDSILVLIVHVEMGYSHISTINIYGF